MFFKHFASKRQLSGFYISETLVENRLIYRSFYLFRRVDELIQFGINPCTPTKDGTCPLHTASLLESPSGPIIVSKMLSYGADPNVKTFDGLSPLHIAAMWGRVDTINLLLDSGASVTGKDNEDKSALDYAEEAEEMKNQCIDALTCWRPNIRRSGDFISRGREGLNKIKGGHVLLSSFNTTINSIMTDTKINKYANEVEKSKYKTNLLDKGMAKLKNSFQSTPVTNKIQSKFNTTPTILKTKPPKCLSEPIKKTKKFFSSFTKDSTFQKSLDYTDNSVLNETVFQSCNDVFEQSILDDITESPHVVSSTFLEDQHVSSDDMDTSKYSRKGRPKEVNDNINQEYFGDISQPDDLSSQSDELDETFFSVSTSLILSPLTKGQNKLMGLPRQIMKDRHDNNSPLFVPITGKSKKQKFFKDVCFLEKEKEKNEETSSLNNFLPVNSKENLFSPLKEQGNYFSPLRPRNHIPYIEENHISPKEEKSYFTGPVLQERKENIPPPQYCPSCQSLKSRNKFNVRNSIGSNTNKMVRNKSEEDNSKEQILVESFSNLYNDKSLVRKPPIGRNGNFEIIVEGDYDEKDSDYEKEEVDPTQFYYDIDLEAEATVDYSNSSTHDKSKVPNLVQYYEDRNEAKAEGKVYCTVQQKNKSFDEVDGLNTSGRLVKKFVTFFDCTKEDTLDEFETIEKRLESMRELSDVTIDYDWKDVSQSNATIESRDSIIIVPPAIADMTNDELRSRLRQIGENPGPISGTTRNIYERHLVKLEKNQEKPLRAEDKYKDYTFEMRQVLLGIVKLDLPNYVELEQEMSAIFTNPDKHTWREGTIKMSFNYILLDPRVTKDLPNRADDMSSLEQLRVFTAAIFYIGKAKKSRPYEHFHEATKYEMSDKSKPCSNKIRVILDIWNAGYGVVSLHVFHNIIPVEAYTREACMVEAMGLSRLTNLKRGDFYGPASSWSAKKKRQLGIHLILKAMKIYVIEGERQIRQKDLTK